MELNQTGLTLENLVHIIPKIEHFTALLLDIQNEYRIRRALDEDPNDKLLTASRTIDDIIERMGTLEDVKKRYFEEQKEKEL